MSRLVLFFIRLLARLPLCVLYGLSDSVLYPIMRYVVGYRRDVVEKNLAFAFPDKSDAERLTIEKAFYHQLCDVLIETIKMSRMTYEELQRHFEWQNLDEVKDVCRQTGRSALCYFAHYGSWEWAIGCTNPDAGVPTAIIYSRLHNTVFNDQMLQLRARYGCKPIYMQTVSEELQQAIQQHGPHIVMAMADQLPKEQYVRHFHRFMGIKTKVLTGTEQLIRKFGMTAFFCRVERVRRGYYTCHAERLDTPTEEGGAVSEWPITDAYFDRLQEQIYQQPALWLWSHDRWHR